MKRYLILFTCLIAAFSACKEENPGYYKGENYIQFQISGPVGHHDITANPIETPEILNSINRESTAYFRLEVIGYPSNQPRKIKLQQFASPNSNGKTPVAGVNFVPFDDPRMEEFLVLPAGQMTVDIPIIITYDPETVGTTQNFTLEFLIVESEFFKPVVSNARAELKFTQNLD